MNWNELFAVFKGHLIWRQRPPEAFSSKKEWRRWTTRYAGKAAGCTHNAKKSKTLYWQVSYGKKRYFAHNVIWSITFGEIPKGMMVDHIDGNGLNNWPDNLRLVTAAENSKNKPIHSNNTSGAPGVHFDTKTGRWYARASLDGKREIVYSGYSQEDAINARLESSARYGYHKNHGRLQSA